MSITFDNTPIEWENKGIEPPETVKANGFTAGYKPPASYFNFEWALVNDCLKELQIKLSDYHTLNEEDKEKLAADIATKLDLSEFTATKIIALLNAASGLNADTLDGHDSTYFAVEGHTHTFEALTSKPTTITGYGITDSIGKGLGGQTVSPTQDTTVTAGANAEIFNDYGERTYYYGYPMCGNIASGNFSHAEGCRTTASGSGSHAEGEDTKAQKDYSHAEGYNTTASGQSSHAEGENATASGKYSHAEGSETKASASGSHAEGTSTTASGGGSHAEGSGTTASGVCSHTEGTFATASGHSSHAEGCTTTANEFCSHAEGNSTTASGAYSHAGGQYTKANQYQLVHGRFNKESAGPTSDSSNTGDLFILGNGTSETARTNAFRVTTSGKAYGLSNFSGSGAGVAELYEWEDGNANNEDRRGLFVTLVGEKIKIASPDDTYILGAIDPCPYVVGDFQS